MADTDGGPTTGGGSSTIRIGGTGSGVGTASTAVGGNHEVDEVGAGVTAALTEAARELPNRIDAHPDTVERDLMKLVLTIVELLRQLVERQALRRVDQGDLTEEQEERMGLTLMLLEDRMTELRERYGLRASDLNLDLGPLGSLL